MSARAKDWHRFTQNDEYLQLSVERLSQPKLIWVDQVSEIIANFLRQKELKDVKLKDIGCNVGHFYRGVRDLGLSIQYSGYDISETYVNIARKYFETEVFEVMDFSKPLDKADHLSDITVISATLEHIEDWQAALNNIFDTTKELVIIRSFIGEKSLKQVCHKPDSLEGYVIYQFSDKDITGKARSNSWDFQFVEDRATSSKPKLVCEGITRTMKICVFKKLD